MVAKIKLKYTLTKSHRHAAECRYTFQNSSCARSRPTTLWQFPVQIMYRT